MLINSYRFASATTYDTDAQAYITAVEAADLAAGVSGGLETATKDAINAFVVGCKADGIWTAIKASCILAGARTLAGALMPLVGTAPTNGGGLFVNGDYNRKTGLVGNGSNKYLNSNQNVNANPQDNCHIACYRTRSSTGNQTYIGARTAGAVTGGKYLWTIGSAPQFTVLPATDINDSAGADTIEVATFQGASRTSPTSVTGRIGGQSYSFTRSSTTPVSNSLRIFAGANSSIAELYSSARIAFYSIGESLDLALLDARVTTLINAFSTAIP